MAHAEKCPTCEGRGAVPNNDVTLVGAQDICCGCNGRGRVEVSDGLNDVPSELWPVETIGGYL